MTARRAPAAHLCLRVGSRHEVAFVPFPAVPSQGGVPEAGVVLEAVRHRVEVVLRQVKVLRGESPP